jgi:4-amino-4-deoxy-L-arabinose transferase-like glycosyltransferase
MDLSISGSTLRQSSVQAKLTTGRGKAFLFILIAWSVIFLPGLGRQGLRGEEGRRVLPAVEMLKTGNWVLPRIAGQDYYNKPPGINWLVAASFVLTGEQSELTARLPSVIFVLIFASLLIWIPIPWLNLESRLLGVIIYMTNIAIVERGRQIEIESVYIALTGIAIILWLNVWSRNGPGWLLWLAPSIVLAFGMLVKGPYILIFFYSIVISVLCYSKKLKSLFSIWHFVGAGIILFLFCGWLWLAFQQTSASKMTSQMSGQLLMRIITEFDFLYWGHNVVMEFVNFLPWLVFLPMLWDKKLISRIVPQYLALFRGSRLGIVIGFCIITLMPKMEDRYIMPLIPIVSVLLGWMLSLQPEYVATDRLWKNILLAGYVVFCVTGTAGLIFVSRSAGAIIALAAAICATVFIFIKHKAIQNKPGLSLATMLLVMIVMLQYSTIFLDISVPKENRAPMASDINRIVPADETINLFKPGTFVYPAVFRFKPHVRYILDTNDIDEQVHYMLIKQKDLNDLSTQEKIAARSPQIIYEFTDLMPNEYRLVRLE